MYFSCERFEERLAAINEPTRDGETANFEDKIYNLEMQLINEKQKASHAINKHSKVDTYLCFVSKLKFSCNMWMQAEIVWTIILVPIVSM